MASKFFNVTGELTQELLSPGNNVSASQISLTNIHGADSCKVDMFIEKKLEGKFYLFKDIKLAIGSTFLYTGVRFSNKKDQFGLFIKLTKSATDAPAVDVILS